jgi:hypothetical protein
MCLECGARTTPLNAISGLSTLIAGSHFLAETGRNFLELRFMSTC